jgi:hypothetical protein
MPLKNLEAFGLMLMALCDYGWMKSSKIKQIYMGTYVRRRLTCPFSGKVEE